MNIAQFFWKLKSAESVCFHEPVKQMRASALLEEANWSLPEDHRVFLAMTDGVEVFGGYFRIFGLNPKRRINLVSWNSKALWKFAWDGLLDDYLCFGETAWGDQYAYRFTDLQANSGIEIYYLDGITMSAGPVSDSFSDFIERAILRNAFDSHDVHTVQVRRRLGDLQLDEHVAYVPSLLIEGTEDPEKVMKLDAVGAMIINGDLYMQLGHQDVGRRLQSLETYVDAYGRERLKVIWADN